jgi:hypothetical protein
MTIYPLLALAYGVKILTVEILGAFGKWAFALLIAGAFVFSLASAWPERGTISITRADYNTAMQKWRTADIQGYEMVVRYSRPRCGIDPTDCGTWTIRVDGDEIDVLRYKPLYSRVNLEPVIKPDDLKFLTVDSLFQEADRILTSGPYSKGQFPLDYTVKFDPVLGYPVEISQQGRQPSKGFVSTEGWRLGQAKKIYTLKVLHKR